MSYIYTNYKIGDILRCENGLGIKHVGLVVGVDSVFHNPPERGEHVSSLREFSKEISVEIQSSKCDQNLVLARVHQHLANPASIS